MYFSTDLQLFIFIFQKKKNLWRFLYDPAVTDSPALMFVVNLFIKNAGHIWREWRLKKIIKKHRTWTGIVNDLRAQSGLLLLDNFFFVFDTDEREH